MLSAMCLNSHGELPCVIHTLFATGLPFKTFFSTAQVLLVGRSKEILWSMSFLLFSGYPATVTTSETRNLN